MIYQTQQTYLLTNQTGVYFSPISSQEGVFESKSTIEENLSFQFQKSVFLEAAERKVKVQPKRLIDAEVISVKTSQVQIGRKTSLLWSRLSKNIIVKLEKEQDPVKAKETMLMALQTFKSQVENDLESDVVQFLAKFIADVKEKPLSTMQSKYFSAGRESALNFKTAIIPEMFRIFAGLEKEIDINTLLANESKDIGALLSKQTEMCAMNRNEMLRLLVALKNKERSQERSQFDCYVLDTEEMAEFLDSAFTVFSDEQNPSKRLQLIVRSDVHYTAVELELGHERNLALVMDAALDPRMEAIIATLEKTGQFAKIYVASETKIQNDTFNCGTFSFNQLCNSSKDAQLFEHLASFPVKKEEGNVLRINWISFPAKLVKNAQSLRFIDAHAEKDLPIKRELTLAGYVAQHVIQKQLSPERTVKVNSAIENKFNAYASLTTASIETMPAEDLTRIVCSYALNDFALKHLTQ